MECTLFQIFSNLPAKSVFILSTVSKQCLQFLSEKLFAKTQSQNLQLQDDQGFFLQTSAPPMYNLCIELHNISPKIFCGIPSKSLNFLKHIGYVLASSNGLLCCQNLSNDKEHPLLLCNPVTQAWLPIIKPVDEYNPNVNLNIVFECNGRGRGAAETYTLMVVLPEASDESWGWSSERNCKIYSPSQNKWVDTGNMYIGGRDIKYEGAAFIKKSDGDIIYFVSDCGPYLTKASPFYWPYVVSYNLKTSTSTLLNIPKGARKGIPRDGRHDTLNIFKFRDPQRSFDQETICLVKFMKYVFSVWVLMDSDKNKWKRIMKAGTKGLGLKGNTWEEKPKIMGLTVFNGNAFLIATDREIYRHDLSISHRHGSVKAEKVGDHGCGERFLLFHSYSNTLRSCGDDAISLPNEDHYLSSCVQVDDAPLN